MPGGREKPLHLQSTSDLWVGIIGFPAFGSFFVAVPLVLGTPVGGSWWSMLWMVLLFSGLFMLAGALVGVPRLKELRRRGEWVPPGMAWQPALVSIVLVFLIMAVAIAIIFVGFWISEPANSPVVSAIAGGGLVGTVIVFINQIGRRLIRRPPASAGNGATKPSPPAGRPPE